MLQFKKFVKMLYSYEDLTICLPAVLANRDINMTKAKFLL